MTKQELKTKCREIAREHNVEIKFIKGETYGYYIPNTNKIAVGVGGSKRSIMTIFSHEMGHVFNFRNKKYYKYHRYVGKQYTKRFKTKHRAVDYALKAEIYTDTVGIRLAKKWFPELKYKRTYKYNDAYYNYLYNKFFGGYYIIILQDFFYGIKKRLDIHKKM